MAWEFKSHPLYFGAAYEITGLETEANKQFDGTNAFSTGSEFRGQLADVSVWTKALTAADIGKKYRDTLFGDESGLVGYWPMASTPEIERLVVEDQSSTKYNDRLIEEQTPNKYNGRITGSGKTKYIPSDDFRSRKSYSVDAAVDANIFHAASRLRYHEWAHLAAVFNQSCALRFTGTDYLDVIHSADLDITDDLTLEVFLQLETLSQPQGIIAKGLFGNGFANRVPYALNINPEGHIFFSYENNDGSLRRFSTKIDPNSTAPGPIKAGVFHRIAVTRQYISETLSNNTNVKSFNGQEIAIYVDYKEIRVERDADPVKPGSGRQNLLIAQGGEQRFGMKGIISEVRIWNVTRGEGDVCRDINGVESGLVTWWRMEDKPSKTAYDSVSDHHAKFSRKMSAQNWVDNPDPNGSLLTLYINGSLALAEAQSKDTKAVADFGVPQFTLGAKRTFNSKNKAEEIGQAFKGELEEVRIWKMARTQEQIQDNLFCRLLGERDQLIANYRFEYETSDYLEDSSGVGNHLTVHHAEAANWIISTAPVSYEIPQARNALASVRTAFHSCIKSVPGVQEYGDLQHDAEGNLIGIMKRCYSLIQDGLWNLVTGFKVGNLLVEWIGQVQYAPQLIGYIEGAPPIPGENLVWNYLETGSYSQFEGVSSIELEEADTTIDTYSVSKEKGEDQTWNQKVGFLLSNTLSEGVEVLGFSYSWNAVSVNLGVGTSETYEASQGWTDEATVRYGQNLRKSTRYDFSGSWESADVSHFECGRRYIPKNIGLALVQSSTADLYALRLEHNHALVSYSLRPNPDIPPDWNIITFRINPRYTKQGTLDGKVGFKSDGSVQFDSDYNMLTADYGEYSYFKPREAYALKNQIRRQEDEMRSGYQRYVTQQSKAAAQLSANSLQTSSAPTLYNQLPAISSRNLVNTYIWTADGGFFAESTNTLDATEELIGSSYLISSLKGTTVENDLTIYGLGYYYEYSSLSGSHLNVVRSKNRNSEKAFNLNINVSLPRDIQLIKRTKLADGTMRYHYQFDTDGRPVLKPGRVDAYRFMTFYLQPDLQHFEDFVHKVVDPIWLKEDSWDAQALRQAIAAQQNGSNDHKSVPWRIFHRVTYVSRVLPRQSAIAPAPSETDVEDPVSVASNYELIKQLEPFVVHARHDYVAFTAAVRQSVQQYLPELIPNVEDIVRLMCLYFEVFEDGNDALIDGSQLEIETLSLINVETGQPFMGYENLRSGVIGLKQLSDKQLPKLTIVATVNVAKLDNILVRFVVNDSNFRTQRSPFALVGTDSSKPAKYTPWDYKVDVPYTLIFTPSSYFQTERAGKSLALKLTFTNGSIPT